MNDIKVLTIGGSRNIGYFSSKRLLGMFNVQVFYEVLIPLNDGEQT